MLIEEAIVKSVQGSTVSLEPRQGAVCDGCSMKKGCGHRLFDSLFSNRDSAVIARLDPGTDPQGIRQGSTVRIAMEEGRLLAASAILYGLPLAGLGLGALLVAGFTAAEGLILAGAVGGLTGGLLLARRLARRIERDSLRVITAEAEVSTSTQTIPSVSI